MGDARKGSITMDMVSGLQAKPPVDVDYAKRNVDPARPKEEPHDENAKAAAHEQARRPRDETVVRFGGSLRAPAKANNHSEAPPKVHRHRKVDVKT
jgi:hypothetical protein